MSGGSGLKSGGRAGGGADFSRLSEHGWAAGCTRSQTEGARRGRSHSSGPAGAEGRLRGGTRSSSDQLLTPVKVAVGDDITERVGVVVRTAEVMCNALPHSAI